MIASQLFSCSEEKNPLLLQFLKSVKQVSGLNCSMLFPRINVGFSSQQWNARPAEMSVLLNYCGQGKGTLEKQKR